MRVFSRFAAMPRVALLLATPLGVFLIAAALSMGGGNNQKLSALPGLDVAVSESAVPTPAAATPAPAPANRANCDAIRDTPYQSMEEREWFLANCIKVTTVAAPITTGGAVTGARPPSTGETSTGDRLVIPAAGVDAAVSQMYVPADAAYLPNPTGYFNAVWYDLSAFPGYGGYVEGNMVFAGHVDCARCHNGSPGIAVFYYLRNLQPGDEIIYYTASGETYRYQVREVLSYPKDVNILPLVDSNAADMTLITCAGNWDASLHEYSNRIFVFANLV